MKMIAFKNEQLKLKMKVNLKPWQPKWQLHLVHELAILFLTA